ncbi:MAG: sporulation protein YabP [Clostridia bacterium]|nr:sporulation protein YabP [Clostridia bacterium]
MREQTNNAALMPHSLELTERKKAVVRGVQAVDSFNEQMVTLVTTGGALTLLGSGLHVSHLSLEEGQLLVEGEIAALEYDSARRAGGSWLSRLTR